MRVLRVDPENIDAEAIREAATVIARGGLVAFPTETVYGLGADATSASAVAGIFNAKGRPSYNPLIVHAANVTDASRCVTSWPDAARSLAERFWPGPLTMVLPKDRKIPDIVTAGLPTVGVRVPNHPVALALLRAVGVPLAAPSANRSMHVSPTIGDHVAASLGGAPDLILDAGPVSVGIESTVVDLSGEVPVVLRPGMITADDLRRVLGSVDVPSAHVPDGAARSSPGMMDRHYSPDARVIVADRERLLDAARAESTNGAKVVVLARTSLESHGLASWPMPESAGEYARLLYGMLHRADAEGYTVVMVEAVPPESAWDGIRDRLRRASR